MPHPPTARFRDCPLNRRKRYAGTAASSLAAVCRSQFPKEFKRKKKTSDFTPPKLKKQKKTNRNKLTRRSLQMSPELDQPLQKENTKSKIAAARKKKYAATSKLTSQDKVFSSIPQQLQTRNQYEFTNGKIAYNTRVQQCISFTVCHYSATVPKLCNFIFVKTTPH